MRVEAPLFVMVDGHTLAYDEVCPPDPKGTVLLLTGLGSKRLGWARQLPVFGQTYRTLALDHRDTGDSDLTPAPYTTADQADDAAAVLRTLGVGRAAVVGISMGGFIALEMALRHPDLVEKLVLTSTSAGGWTHTRARLSLLLKYMQPHYRWGEVGAVAKRHYAAIMAPGYCRRHPDEWEHIAEVARYRPQSREAYQRQWRTCVTHDVADRLGEIHVPTLVVHGEGDPLVPVENGRYLARHIAGARLILYPRTGHIPIVERAEEYNRDVLAFLAE
ncbi:MAG: alpha/beta fold hydrolase [Ktedonobacterales bacterium]|nr:alpha/beta fold hydrolase [Ktedonobacterales bacterium]